MSAISDALSGLHATPRGPKCSVGALLDDLKDNDPAGYELLAEALHNPDIPAPQIVKALSSVGIRLHRDSILRHRRRAKGSGCACA